MIDRIDELMPDFFKRINERVNINSFNTMNKTDGSPVTDIDMHIHDLFFEFCKEKGFEASILSEESIDSTDVLDKFPVFIIDPIDGTKEFIKGNGEWSVSIAFLNSEVMGDPLNRGWIYQPHLNNLYHCGEQPPKSIKNNKTKKILVSRTEYNDGLFDNLKKAENIEIIPMGSIALKLGKLGALECDAVITFRPKSIWDLAAGLVISARNHGTFYSESLDKSITHFHTKLTYKSPMLFGNGSNKDFVEDILKLLKS